jgi:hypothetical protein
VINQASAVDILFGNFATWKNSWLNANAGQSATKSKGATAFCAEVGTWIGNVSCKWEKWNWLILGGEVTNGVMDSTPTDPLNP